MSLNAAREAIEQALAARRAELERTELEHELAEGAVDITLPGTPVLRGHLHLRHRITHRNAQPGRADHVQVVMVVSDSDNLFGDNALLRRQLLQRRQAESPRCSPYFATTLAAASPCWSALRQSVALVFGLKWATTAASTYPNVA